MRPFLWFVAPPVTALEGNKYVLYTGALDRRVMCGWRTVSSQDGLTTAIDLRGQMIHGQISSLLDPADHPTRVGVTIGQRSLEVTYASW